MNISKGLDCGAAELYSITLRVSSVIQPKTFDVNWFDRKIKAAAANINNVLFC